MTISSTEILNLDFKTSEKLFLEIRKEFGLKASEALRKLFFKSRYAERTGKWGVEIDGFRWIYHTAEEFAEELGISARQFHRIVAKFKEYGLVMVRKCYSYLKKTTNFYAICFEKLAEFLPTSKPKKVSKCQDQICHDVNIIIEEQNNLTNKINKSEGYPQAHGSYVVSYDQVNQVQNIIKFDEERKDLAPRNPPNTTSQDMLSIWNEVLGHKSKAVMSKDLATWLVAAFNQKFNKEQVKWRSYCQMIASSSYMMSDSFDLEIQWALKFSTINKIFEGNLGVKYKDGIAKNAEIKHTIERGIESIDEPLEIKELRRKISESIGSAEYYSWFHPATFGSEDGKIKLTAQNPYAQRIWNERYLNLLEDLVGRGRF
jgi:hypothetical protein